MCTILLHQSTSRRMSFIIGSYFMVQVCLDNLDVWVAKNAVRLQGIGIYKNWLHWPYVKEQQLQSTKDVLIIRNVGYPDPPYRDMPVSPVIVIFVRPLANQTYVHLFYPLPTTSQYFRVFSVHPLWPYSTEALYPECIFGLYFQCIDVYLQGSGVTQTSHASIIISKIPVVILLQSELIKITELGQHLIPKCRALDIMHLEHAVVR